MEEFCNGELGSPKEVVEKAHKGTNPEKDCTKLGGPGGITAYRQRDKKFGLGHCALTTCAYYAATSNFEYKYPFGSKIGDGDHPLPFRRRKVVAKSSRHLLKIRSTYEILYRMDVSIVKQYQY